MESAEGINFHGIGKIDGNGNSNTTQHYSFKTPESIYGGYYKLKQVDYDGNYSMSESIFIDCNQDISLNNVNVYYNSENTSLTIEQLPINQEIDLILTDMEGRIIDKIHFFSSSSKFLWIKNISSKSIYLLKIISATEQKVFKLIIQ